MRILSMLTTRLSLIHYVINTVCIKPSIMYLHRSTQLCINTIVTIQLCIRQVQAQIHRKPFHTMQSTRESVIATRQRTTWRCGLALLAVNQINISTILNTQPNPSHTHSYSLSHTHSNPLSLARTHTVLQLPRPKHSCPQPPIISFRINEVSLTAAGKHLYSH